MFDRRLLELPMLLSYFKSWTGLLSVVAVLFLSGASNGDILDQSSPAGNLSFFVNEELDQAQTFTVGLSGQLTQFDLFIGRAAATTDDLLIDIRQITGAAGPPTEPNAGSNIVVTVTASAVSVPTTPSWNIFDISASNIPVLAGEEYAIALRSASDDPVGYTWLATAADPYAGGSSYQRLVTTGAPWQDSSFTKDVDLPFRTFVAIPEPSFVFGMTSLSLLSAMRRRRRS